MNVLAIFTALPELCVAAEGKRGRFLIAAEGSLQQAEDILPFMEQAAEAAGFSLKETELVTAAEGPGSFTGLRLGYAAAKAIQLSAACPFIPVPTFEAWARSLSGLPAPLFCVMDAKKKRFYGQFFARGEALSSVMDISPHEAGRKALAILERQGLEGVNPLGLVIAGPHGKALASSEGFAAALEGHPQKPALCFAPVPCGGIFSMIELAKEMLALYNDSPIDYSIGPVYVRKSDAEASNGI